MPLVKDYHTVDDAHENDHYPSILHQKGLKSNSEVHMISISVSLVNLGFKGKVRA